MTEFNNPPAELEFDLCGQHFVQKNSFDIIRRIEEATGKSIMALSVSCGSLEMTITTLANIYFQLVRREKGAPTINEIGEFMVRNGARTLMTNLGEFLAKTYVGHVDEALFEKGEKANPPTASQTDD